MPLYEYFCLDCRTGFDRLRALELADAAVHCPTCEGERTRRKLSLVAARVASSDGIRANPSPGGCACGGACACSGH